MTAHEQAHGVYKLVEHPTLGSWSIVRRDDDERHRTVATLDGPAQWDRFVAALNDGADELAAVRAIDAPAQHEQAGPYVVTLTESREAYERRRAADPDAHRRQGVSRRAFETLDGDTGDTARRYCRRLLGERRVWSTEEVDVLPAEGGTVTLPDGRSLEVKLTGWSDLAAEVDYLGRGFLREEEWPEVIAAVNAKWAEEAGR